MIATGRRLQIPTITRHGKPLFTRLVMLASATVLAVGAAVLVSAGSASAATCSGFTCHGHNPVTYGCPVSSTVTVPVDYNGVQIATLWNRYSYDCNANWGRAQLTAAGLKDRFSFEVSITTTDSHGDQELMCYPGPNNTGQLVEACPRGQTYSGSLAAYTDMVDGTNTTRAQVALIGDGQVIISSPASQ